LPEHTLEPGAHVPTHAPLTHAWFEHAIALAYWPSDPHVCTPLPEHFVVPGTQTPPQAPLTHVFVQALAAPHVPVELHVSTPLVNPASPAAPHWVLPGAQTPWQDAVEPDVTHAWLLQGTAVPHWPALHVWTAFPEHWE
jgi:hypothetical protein